MASDGCRTSRVTVFTIPPRNIGLEGRDEFVRICEGKVAFLASVVPMITLARFVVVPKDALTANNVGKPVFESMIRAWQWCRKLPEHQFSEREFGVNDSSPNKLESLHVGDCANARRALSMTPTEAGIWPGRTASCPSPGPNPVATGAELLVGAA
jgi:hypothetical protein